MYSRLNFLRHLLFAPVLCLLHCFLLVNTCAAQNITARAIDLPGSFNRDLLNMAVDEEGFTWFSTNEGLWRFDGTDVKLFDYKKLKLPQNTGASSLFCYHQFLFFVINKEMHVYNTVTDECIVYDLQGIAYNFELTPAGNLLFITVKGQAFTFSAGKMLQKAFNLADFSGWDKKMEAQRTAVDANGDIYVFIRGRVGHIESNNIRWSPLDTPDSLKTKVPLITVYSVAVTSHYIAAHYYNGQVIVYDKQSLKPLYQYWGEAFAYCLAVNNRVVLIKHIAAAKADYQPSDLFDVTGNNIPDIYKLRSMVYAKDQGKFFTATNLGILQFSPAAHEQNQYTRQAKLVSFFRNKSVRSIYSLHNNFYVGTYSGFFECTPDTIRQIATLIVYTIKQFNDSVLLLSIEGGVGCAFYNTKSGQYIPFAKDPGRTFYVFSLYKDGNRWLAGGGNALHYLEQKNERWSVRDQLVDSSLATVRQIKRIRGKLFIAAQNGVSTLDDNYHPQKIYPAKNLLRVYCMQETNDGIWLGTHGEGLVKIDDNGNVLQQAGFNEGLAGNFVYSLTIMKNLMVAGTSNGITVFNIENGMQPLPIKKDDSLYGLSTQECNHSAIFYDTIKQQVILGGIKGLLFADYKDYSNTPGFKNNGLILSYIKTGGHETNSAQANLLAYAADKIVIRPEDVNVTLKFAATGTPGPADGLFRIVGLDDKWQRIRTDQEVNLYALPPGTYTLQAHLPSAINTSEWFTKTIVVEPAFYQTILFKGVLVLCFLGIVYLLWRSKVKKIEREFQLRTMIASDLHDDIGSTLNSISVYTVVAGQQLHADIARTEVLLDNMGVASRGMIDRMNDIVWAINPKNDDFENVLERMQFFAAELLSGKNMLLKFDVDERIKKSKFSMQQRKNIYLIYKEAVNNAYKYSGGTTVKVQINKEANYLQMIIADDGAGFSTETKNSGGRNGLVNMKNRAKEIGGKLTITSSPAQGVSVQLNLRLS